MRLSIGIIASLLATATLASSNSRFFRRQTNVTGYAPKEGPLDTPWTDKVGTNPWPEYPRPQLQRSQWKSLNGVWRYQNASGLNEVDAPPFEVDLASPVLVPFCLESALSGVMGNWTIFSWYQTSFTVPSSWSSGNRVLLNFGAVDYEATVFVNRQKVGFHRGGYFGFTIDVTDYLSVNGTNEMLVFAHDPTDSGTWQIPIGKQTLEPSHIFYTPCSGIWQSVWLESAPANHITQLDLSADMDGKVNVNVHSSGNASTPVEVTIYEPHSTDVKATAKGNSGSAFEFTVDSPDLWSPDSPTLYNITIKMGSDTITSYTGFRTVSKAEIDGVMRPLLNGEFVFQFGTLDQGFWPDGIYTPPTREAMIYDLQVLKRVGYNMLRKHIKIEPALFYQAADEIGIMLIQDMPSMRPSIRDPNSTNACPPNVPVGQYASQLEFNRQLELMINQLKNYPSIVTWVIYNEGWGQERRAFYPEFGLMDLVRSIDPTRLINPVTGWHDHGAGDFHDNHHYANPQCGTPFYSVASTPYDPRRIAIQGEFGGVGQNVTEDHLWKVPAAVRDINQTYEIDETVEIWNYRSHILLTELLDQVKRFACSAAVWTQTTDVEGEVNGMLTYDRRVIRMDEEQWKNDIQALYDAAAERASGNHSMVMMPRDVAERLDGSQ
ncbi:glycoside hydrolase family 2 protein [Zopfia rhizophila CBS 207.26]|uniref:Glycoside hydrolase family 2 protein n=1 Tax=Zopfia rhizophila CBS 207.26 TaxID=1314779 RepID=A0A6A6D7Q8_9PEZI|nr:glycoside hydrolase family 2 protein [Zopfia rhizophila CBS 207.26]